jgi:hypothetical protein
MVIFHGERLPADRRTPRLSAPARRCGIVAAGTACLPVAGQETGGGARDRRATAHRARAGRRPEVAEQPATHRQLPVVNLMPLHGLPQRVAILRGIGEGRNGRRARRACT